MINDFDVKVNGEKIRICAFDIETLDLSAQWSYTICASVKTVNRDNLNGKTKTFRIDDYDYKKHEDRDLIRDLVDCLDNYDLVVGWYSSKFDFPFINTRALFYDLKPPQKNYRRDLCLSARGFGKLNNNRLATWDRWNFGKATKTNLIPSIKWKAIRGDRSAIDFYVDHCEKDVYSTERNYKKFLNNGLLGKLRKA